MEKGAGEETDQRSRLRWYIDIGALLAGFQVETQLASVLFPPVLVEIEDGGDGTQTDSLELIKVTLVETARRVDGKVSLELEESEIEAAVDGEPQVFQMVIPAALGRRGQLGIQPHHPVGTEPGIDVKGVSLPDPGMSKASGIPEGPTLPCQLADLFALQKARENPPPRTGQGIHYRCVGFHQAPIVGQPFAHRALHKDG